MSPRCTRCGKHSRMRSACASRASAARPSSARAWCRRSSTACSLRGCCGRARPRRPRGRSTGTRQSGTCVRRCCGRSSSSYPTPVACNRSASSRCWTGRPRRSTAVDREAFFERFSEGEAVQYFYEPFLAEFDPQLRRQLGVWYTPPEVVRYMVARVDRALKDDLGIADGLAADNVYVLDPCCGTGAYLGEVLRRIDANLRARGSGALTGARVKQAAMDRVFGFEIMPAPVRRRAPAGRPHDAGAGCATLRRRRRACRRLPHQRPHRLGAPREPDDSLPGARG